MENLTNIMTETEDHILMIIKNEKHLYENLYNGILKGYPKYTIREIRKNIPEHLALEPYRESLVLYLFAMDTGIVSKLPTRVCEDVERYIKSNPNPCSEIQLKPIEESKMSYVFETKNFVNSKDVSTMSKYELMNAIKDAENEIEKMDKLKVKSKAVEKEKASIQNFIDNVLVILDSKFG